MKVKINEIFSSIQGEGRWAGHPAIFIRFAGCRNNCSFCDTEYAQNGGLDIEIEEVTAQVEDLVVKSSTVEDCRIDKIVITGGEPFEQAKALLSLHDALWKKYGSAVTLCIETSGSVPVNDTIKIILNSYYIDKKNWLTVSPKNALVNEQYIWVADQIKILVGSSSNDDIPVSSNMLELLETRRERVCFQPIDYKHANSNKAAILRAIDKAFQYGGTVSAQMHKFLNIR